MERGARRNVGRLCEGGRGVRTRFTRLRGDERECCVSSVGF